MGGAVWVSDSGMVPTEITQACAERVLHLRREAA